MADLGELIEALSEPGFYPNEPESVEVRQTDSSVIFLLEDRVFKLKKPISHTNQNYSTPARRRRMCNMEVELNSRLSPSLYIDVHKVTTVKDGFTLNGRGKVADYMIEMNRLDDDRCLAHLIETDEAGEEEIRAIARKLADFHREAEQRQLINTFSRPHIIARQWNRRLRQSAEYVGTIFSAQSYTDIVTFASTFLGEQRSVLQGRIDKGYVCDGHGDLHTGHIYLQNGIQVIDCVEYNDRERYGDVAFDIAGLVMSLDAHGTPDLGDALIDEYEKASGIDLSPVLDFYLCFRAHEIGMQLGQAANIPEIPLERHQDLVRRARRYFHLAHRYARGDRQPMLLIMSGVMGAGKSRLAEAISDVLAINYVQASVENERFPRAIGDNGEEEVVEDDPIGEQVDEAYDDLMDRAKKRLARGRSVVLDSTFHNSTYRVAARTLARAHDAEFMLIECDTDDEIIRERVRQTQRGLDATANERLKLLREQQKAFRPSREIYRKDKVQVDTASSLEEQLQTVLAEL